LQGHAAPCDGLHECQSTPQRIRTLGVSCGKTALPEKSAAKSGALTAENNPTDSDLQAVIEQWEDLPEAAKDHIAAMLRAADGKG